MIGDKLLITDYHRAGAATAMETIRPLLEKGKTVTVSVAGESGGGKSEIGHCIAQTLIDEGKSALVLGQDDYFKLPPKSNHQRRQQDISWVGPGEVKLDLLDSHLAALKTRSGEPLEKPLVYFEEDRIGTETIQGGPFQLVVAEGTYTSQLENLDVRVFINRTYHQTKKARLARGRDPDVAFLEEVLDIEHRIISKHKERADVVLFPPPEEQ